MRGDHLHLGCCVRPRGYKFKHCDVGHDVVHVFHRPEDHDAFVRLLSDGSQFGVRLTFAVQEKPEGLAKAFVIGESFIGTDSVCMVLGDNLFWGAGFAQLLQKAALRKKGATIFAYQVENPTDFGIVEFDNNFKAISLEEKPKIPK